MLRVALTVTEFESSWPNAAGTDKISRKKGRRFTISAVYSPFMPDQPALLDFQNISVMRGQKTVLDDITLRIQAGEHVAILGPNGSGKSTLIKAITRECYPLAQPGSSLTILGRESWNVFELRTLLGIVSNDLMSTCTRDITGLEAVLSGFFSSIGIQPYHQVTPEMLTKSHQVLDLLELP